MKRPLAERAFRKEVPDVGYGTVISIRFSATKITISIAMGDVIVVVEIPLTVSLVADPSKA
jgi:hypothetical protein